MKSDVSEGLVFEKKLFSGESSVWEIIQMMYEDVIQQGSGVN